MKNKDKDRGKINPIENPKIQIPAIIKELESVLKDTQISNEKKERLIHIVGSSVQTTYISPIPPPEILKGYNEVVNNGAERILAMAEKQSNHRMQLEDYAIKEQLRQSGRGQNYGLVIAIFGLVLAGVLAVLGYEKLAIVLATTTIVGLVTVFVLGKKKQQKSLSEKDIK